MVPMVSNKKSSLSDLRLCSLDPFALRECFCWNISPRSKGGKSEIEESLASSLLSLLTVALNCGRCVSVIKKNLCLFNVLRYIDYRFDKCKVI